MSSLDARIILQRSRFNLIQDAAEREEIVDSSINRQLVMTKLNMLEHNWSKFQENHENICSSEIEGLSYLPYIKEKIYERCHAFYVFSRAKLVSQQEEYDTLDQHSRASLSEPVASHPFKPRNVLPTIKLPNFSGDYESWRGFSDLFTSLIRKNEDLSNVEKMHYLKICLTGEAARLISNLPHSGENFSVAWNLLESRYENKRMQISMQLDRITSLRPLKTKSAQGLRSLQTTISETMGALSAMQCEQHTGELILLHILVKLLDPETHEAWEMMHGASSTYPTYKQFEAFLLERTRALENLNLNPAPPNIQKKHSSGFTRRVPSRVAAHVAATTSNANDKKCPLCGSPHYMAFCESYASKSVQQKRDIIVKQRRCFNCLGSHATSKCFSTKRCLKCGKKHHTSIHENNAKYPSKQTTNMNQRKEPARTTEQLPPQVISQ